MDHMRESRLRIDMLQCLVLDEADEMLRMGFVEDVEWILQQTPENRQIALFSATMPDPIRRIADQHLKNPSVVTVASKQRTADTIQQRFLIVDPKHKLEALQRILEAEATDGVIVFVKTKIATVEVADQLKALGYSAVALNGDIPQAQRERTIDQLKEGTINLLVATDVAARGLDVQRISHVINYDLPADAEAYVHRVGRTGRAGRVGQAILFLSPKQRGALRELDKAAGQGIEPMTIPTSKEINALRETRFKERIAVACADAKTASFRGEQFRHFEKLVSQCAEEHELSVLQVAAGLAMLAQGDRPFFVSEAADRPPARERDDRGSKRERKRGPREGMVDLGDEISADMESFRVEVGRIHGVKPGNLVGAVANEIGLDSRHIGPIRIHHDFSTIDLPSGMPREAFKVLGRAWVVGRQLRISKVSDQPRRIKPMYGPKGGKKRKA
jgi:ATP-dependent RNA helicase DeaD